MLHIPILRKGNPYKSIDVQRVPHFKTREMFVEVSQANAGLIRRDLLDLDAAQATLAAFTTEQLIAMCRQAADYFMNGTLPVGEESQTPDDYADRLAACLARDLPMICVASALVRTLDAAV